MKGGIPAVDHQSRQSYTDQMINLVLDLIEGGKLAPGEPVPSIPEMARLQDISARPVQEAYRYLSEHRILAARAGIQTRVNPNLRTEVPDASIFRRAAEPRRSRAKTLQYAALVCPMCGASSFSSIIDAVEPKLHERGYSLIVGNYQRNLERLGSQLRGYLPQAEIRRVFVCPPHAALPRELVALLRALRDRLVFLDHALRRLRAPCVRLDHEKGGRLGAEQILALGKKRILYVSGYEDHEGCKLRDKGFLDALRERGFERDTRVVHGDYSADTARGITLEHFAGRARRPEAVFCINGATCQGVLAGLRECGLAVPDDVAVATFDKQDYRVRSPIPVIAQPFDKVADALASMVIAKRLEPKHVLIEPCVTSSAPRPFSQQPGTTDGMFR
ncbi:MAG: substrate-binding domain-containing protein [Kiritimatiellae bacterium]|nr:substrate-binding domain-containing protein [Kiritimatiellia bacterium]